MLKEFKDFALRGNVMDMAIGVIIGAAFGKVITSLVNDLLMPPIGLLLGKVDFSNLFINLSGRAFASLKVAQDAGAPTLRYGLFLNTVLDFLITAVVIFVIIKQINRFAVKKPAPTEPSLKDCPYCCSAIPLRATRCGYCTSEISKAA